MSLKVLIMKKVSYDIYDVRHGGHFWNMEFQNKREAESYLYHALRDGYYNGEVDNGIWQLRGYIKDQQQYLKVVDRTPEKPKTKKQLELEEQERQAHAEESKKKEAEFIAHCKEQLAKNLHNLYDTSKITEDLVAIKIDDVVVDVGSGEWYAYINIIAGGERVYRGDLASVTKPIIFDKNNKILYVVRKWLKRRSPEVKALRVEK